MTYISRRHFLGGTGALSFAAGVGALSSFTASPAWAANTSGYKAMVCIFLKGGMDHADTILPYDQTSYNQLRTIRTGLYSSYNSTDPASSRYRDNLLRLNPLNQADLGGREYALPQALAPLHTMFEQGDMAILGDVGPLIEPVSRSQMDAGTAILPNRLFSHNDQQSTWMSFASEGQRIGWGGRFMDASLASAPGLNPQFASISAGSNDVFLSGETSRPFRVASGGVREPLLLSSRNYIGNTSADNEARDRIRAFLKSNNLDEGNIFAQDLRRTNSEAQEAIEGYTQAQESAGDLTTEFQSDSYSRQMEAVANTIKIQQYLNVPRQMFYVSSGGFDTHSSQVTSLAGRHAQLAAAMSSFREAMIELGEWNNVLVFTMSDFGRTLIDNGDGTDHGWGGHQFIAGGSVSGQRVYGTIAAPDLESERYTQSRGRLIPSTSVEQYAATLGQWFGLTDTELTQALPNLGNFDNRNIGFLGTQV